MGAALLFNQINSTDVGKAFICVLCGVFVRFVTVFIISWQKKFSYKERLFLATAYIPKSTAVATVASVIYNDALALGDDFHDYQVMGLQL